MRGLDEWLTNDTERERAEALGEHEEEVHGGRECNCPTGRDPDDERDMQLDWDALDASFGQVIGGRA